MGGNKSSFLYKTLALGAAAVLFASGCGDSEESEESLVVTADDADNETVQEPQQAGGGVDIYDLTRNPANADEVQEQNQAPAAQPAQAQPAQAQAQPVQAANQNVNAEPDLPDGFPKVFPQMPLVGPGTAPTITSLNITDTGSSVDVAIQANCTGEKISVHTHYGRWGVSKYDPNADQGIGDSVPAIEDIAARKVQGYPCTNGKANFVHKMNLRKDLWYPRGHAIMFLDITEYLKPADRLQAAVSFPIPSGVK